jgi:hypothetical protein
VVLLEFLRIMSQIGVKLDESRAQIPFEAGQARMPEGDIASARARKEALR